MFNYVFTLIKRSPPGFGAKSIFIRRKVMGLIGDLISIRKTMKMTREVLGEEEYKKFRRELPGEIISDAIRDRRNAVDNECCYACKWYHYEYSDHGHCELLNTEIENVHNTGCNNWKKRLL